MITTDDQRYSGSADDDLLDGIRDVFDTVDPMPAGLPDRIRLALLLTGVGAELACLTSSESDLALAARGSEQSRMVTFDSDSLTIMIRIDANADGTARVDGWLAPPRAHLVEIRLPERTMAVTADSLGRFVFPAVPRGTAHLIVRPPEDPVDPEDAASGARDGDRVATIRTVVTPALTLLRGE